MIDISHNLSTLLAITSDASDAVMEIYNANSAVVQIKEDNTPLTQADLASHDIIDAGLRQLFPDIPVVSEEGDKAELATQLQSDAYWLVDPIDGTKEFINRTDQFTICIALVVDGEPVFGIVAAPALDVIYYGGPAMGSFKLVGDGPAEQIHVSERKLGVILGSRLHFDDATAAHIAEHYPNATIEHVGSQLKLPYIAEGKADAYPRMNSPLHLWDLAPGHAIVAGAGGTVTKPDGSPLNYRDESTKIGDFLATS